MARRTPLYTKHIEAGGVMVDFGGYELPVIPTAYLPNTPRSENAQGCSTFRIWAKFWWKARLPHTWKSC